MWREQVMLDDQATAEQRAVHGTRARSCSPVARCDVEALLADLPLHHVRFAASMKASTTRLRRTL